MQLYPPAPDLAYFIERYWRIRWNLDTPYVQETIPFPCVNLVMEPGNSRVYGVVSGKFARRLVGAGGVFGVKFKPGGFCPFVQWPLADLTDRSLPVDEVFGAAGVALEKTMFAAATDDAMIVAMEAFIRARLPEPDEQVALVNQIVDSIVADPKITRVDDLVGRGHLSKRHLQRLFSQYVGVSPKWVIQRYRLHEAAERLADGEASDWTTMALELGYYDQAHFIKDFKALIGVTPAEYAKGAGE